MTRLARSLSIITFVAIALSVEIVQTSQAIPIAYEGFDYGSGENLNDLNGGTGFKDAW